MKLYRCRIFSPIASPFGAEQAEATYRYFDDGYLAVGDDGRIVSVDEWSAVRLSEGDEVVDLGRSALITPGLIDTHLHAPQLEMIGSYGGDLLQWLNRYTFPTEAKFADADHARQIATELFEELPRSGTTSALIFSTLHTEATNIFFEEAERAGIRSIIGKTLMDRNAPANLQEEPETAIEGSRELIRRWHGHDLLGYAISPRFAPTCSDQLLAAAGELRSEYPDVYVHTHVSENRAEVQWVRELFPDARDYVSVYEAFGLLGNRTVLAHGVHLSDNELRILHETDSRIAHCPNSNLFLGSGLFPLHKVLASGVTIGLGSDIGAGTTPCLFNAMADAYKVQQIQGLSLTPFELWYLATLGGARTLSVEKITGSLEADKDADFLILDLEATSLLARRTRGAETIHDLLAGIIFMGDDRAVSAAYVRGRKVTSDSRLSGSGS